MSALHLSATSWGLLALGGVLGTLARFGLSSLLLVRVLDVNGPPLLGPAAGTLLVNVLGSVAIGAIAALAVSRPEIVTPDARLCLAVGFCGAFTTFSAYALDALVMTQIGRWDQAVIYVALSNVLCLAGVALGWQAGHAAA